MSFVNRYRSTTVFGELKVQRFNTGNINGLLDISGNTILSGDCIINGNLSATDGTLDISGNLAVTGDANINGLTIGRGAGSIDTNTVLGKDALPVNTTGYENIAIGYSSLIANTTGSSNTAVGFQASFANTIGNNNTAIGFEAGAATTTGSNNVAVGTSSLTDNITGSSNVAVGGDALDENTGGSFNVGIGDGAGRNNKTGNNNTFLGYNTDISGNVVYNNSTAIGTGAIIDASNQIVIGTSSETVKIPGGLTVTGGINATTATIATDNSNVSFFPTFVSAQGNVPLKVNSGFIYNPFTETLNVTNINGTITNNATTSTIATDSSNQSFFPTFVSATTGNLPLKADASLSYNPSSNILSCDVSGNLTGTASKVVITNTTTGASYRVPFALTATGNCALGSDEDFTFSPSLGILYATVDRVNISQTSTNNGFRITLGSGTGTGSSEILSNGDFTFNPSTGTLTGAKSFTVGAGVWLIDGTNTGSLNAIVPLFTSQTDLGDINNQSELSFPRQDTSRGAAGDYQDPFNNDNKIDTIIVFPNWGIVGFNGTGYSSTVNINYKNTNAFPVFVDPLDNVMSSCKIYFNDVEQ